MTYSILQVSPEAYREVRQRIVAIDESIGGTTYQRDMIMAGKPERILLTGVAIEALPAEHQVAGMSIPIPDGASGVKVYGGNGRLIAEAYRESRSSQRTEAPDMERVAENQRPKTSDHRDARLYRYLGTDLYQWFSKVGDSVFEDPFGEPFVIDTPPAQPFEGLIPVHVDDLNDPVLVGLALEDDARALWKAIGLPGDHAWEDVKDLAAGARIMAAAVAMRRRYLPWTLDDWKPTPEAINALPQPIRGYVMDLETICDPAGEVLAHHQVRQQAAGVEAMYLAEKKDAERWRAILAAAPRLIGSAGVDFPEGEPPRLNHEANDYIHAGFEFWTQTGPKWVERGRSGYARPVLTLIADQIIAQGGEAWAMVNGERVVTPGSGDERDTAGDSPAAPAGGGLAGREGS